MEAGPLQDLQSENKWYKNKALFQVFLATTIIAALNIIVFILMVAGGANVISPDMQTLIDWGANYRLVTLDGQPWRLLTATFLHIGLIHLLMNLYGLLFIGYALEPYLGPIRFAAAYLMCGILASLTSLAMHDNTVSAGASGAIFGMFGLYLALLLSKTISTADSKRTVMNMLVLIGYNLIYGFKDGIDNAAHVGGLLTGFLIGLLCKSDLVKEEDYLRGYMNLCISGAVVIIISWIGLSSIPNNVKYYLDQMKIFSIRENEAVAAYNNLSLDGSKEDILYDINERGIYYWEENVNLLNDLEKISLPDPIVERNKQLKKYCNLRIDSYRLISKGVTEDTDKYQPELEKINEEIDDLVKTLSSE
jgi:rhomboid protease GluP